MFTVKSTKFLNQLAKMREDFSGKRKVAFKLTVPPEMVWWYWQEFGTALYAEKGSSSGNEVGYFVRPVEGKSLKFYDRSSGNFRITNETFVFGIPAHHMITDILPQIQDDLKQIVSEGLRQGYTVETLESYLLEVGVPQIIQLVSQSFEDKLDLPIRPNGKLGGISATQEFDQKVQFEVTTT